MSDTGFYIDETSKIKHDPKNNLSRRDRERVEFWENEKDVDDIVSAGQDNRKEGIKAVQRQQEEQLQEEKKVHDEILNKFDQKKRYAQSYKATLAQTLAQALELLDWMRGWSAQVVVTDGSPITIKGKGFQTQEGLLLLIIDPRGAIFHQGVYVTQDPAVDYLAIQTMALRAENTLDRAKGLFSKKAEDNKNILDQYGNTIS